MPFSHNGAFSYCRWLTRQSRSHFGWGLRFLPRPKRQAMEVVYAFCRAVDDVVDQGAVDRRSSIVDGKERAKKELELWRQELRASDAGNPTHPIGVALGTVIKQFDLPLDYLQEIIDGVEMDLTKRRYATFKELKAYCHRVASLVGLLSIRVFGCRNSASEWYAASLGMALQLTNILRDLKSDLARGRIYLPLAELKQFGVTEEDLTALRVTPAFRKLMAFQCQRAKDYFQYAHSALATSGEEKLLLPAEVMRAVYRELLSRIEASGYDVFTHRVSVPASRQGRIALRCLMRRA